MSNTGDNSCHSDSTPQKVPDSPESRSFSLLRSSRLIRRLCIFLAGGVMLGLAPWLYGEYNFLVGAGSVGIGVAMIMSALYRLRFSALEIAGTGYSESLENELLGRRRRASYVPKIVAIGGGTGLSTLLRGIKEYGRASDIPNISAIVTVSDDGGSSGRLRREFKIPPPGDIRSCLVSLASTETLMESLFQYRFQGRSDLRGHCVGNLFIAALTDITGDFEMAIRESSKILAVRGRILPATVDHIVLGARLANDTIQFGESKISRMNKSAPIKEIFLDPPDPSPAADVLETIMEADIIVLGPGSLYTSIVPNLLIPGLVDAIKASPAKKIYVCNVMTQPGETDGYTASAHLRVIVKHLGPGVLDCVLVNKAVAAPEKIARYASEGAYPVQNDPNLFSMGVEVVREDLISMDNLVRHDSQKVARLILALGYSE